MLKRWRIYFREMHPFLSRFFVGYLLFFEIYFLVILTNSHSQFQIGIGEFIGGYTIFGFLLFLRIADDFKDYQTDLKLFPDRPLPSGRVTKQDLKILLTLDLISMIVLNTLFMNNLYYFIFLMTYGTLMSFWFFSKAKIQKSLPLALITHNPIQLIINLYAISFTCIKYNIPMVTMVNVAVLFSLYFDGLIWEIGRKVRAPQDETEYTTYSKLFGYKKPIYFIIIIMLFDLVTNAFLIGKLFLVAIIGAILGYIWFISCCNKFLRNPKRYKMQSIMEQYMLVTEGYIVCIIILYLILNML